MNAEPLFIFISGERFRPFFPLRKNTLLQETHNISDTNHFRRECLENFLFVYSNARVGRAYQVLLH